MTYREYAKKNDISRTDKIIEENVPFDPDAEMIFIKDFGTHIAYDINGFILYSNNSTFDTVENVDNETGEIEEVWILEF